MVQDSGWRQVPATTEIPAHSVFLKAIEKPETDDRDYRLIRLQNGLQALLIHDPKADKAAAATDVGVGHLSDPDDMPGLAHFCEHLLFMGSAQFPQENAYSEFIHAHGGSTNAWTAASNTNFFFSIGADHLSGALQRFAGFFHSPLFDASCTARELKAVNSEHKKNAQGDMWRAFQVSKTLSRSGHPYTKFGSGNLHSLTYAGRAKAKLLGSTSGLAPTQVNVNNAPPEDSDDAEASLQGEDGGVVGQETRRRVMEWWGTHYSASNMNLAILGKDSLDDLMKMVTDNFSSVVTRDAHRISDPRLQELPWGPEQQRQVVAIQTVMDFRMLQVQWVLPEQESNYESKPTTILSHFIGHEGPGSLHSYFKQKGWITYLGAGSVPAARGFGFFNINLMLTKTGLGNWKTLVEIIFNYMSLLRTSEFPNWVFAELEAITEARFRFAQKRSPADYVSSLSEHLTCPWSKDRIISGKTRLWKWDEPAVREMLERDLAPEALGLTLLAKDFLEIGLDGPWSEEAWYKTKYQVFPLDGELVEKARRPHQITELFLPTLNEFIPTNFGVDKQSVTKPATRPSILRTTPISTLWHKKDDQFWLPKGVIQIDIRSPIAGITPRNAVMTAYIASLITDALTEFAYDADLAGLSYDISETSAGLGLTVGGYNEKAHVLLKRVLEKARTLVVDPDRFEVIREQFKQNYENFYVDVPHQIADWFAVFAIHEVVWSPQERLDELAHITPAHVQTHLFELWQRTGTKILVHGNFSTEEALRVQDLVDTTVGSRGILPTECLNRSHLLPRPGNFVHNITLTNPKETNGAVIHHLAIGNQADDHLRTRLLLVDHLLKDPTFSVLRTKEQLGYVVQSMIWYRASSLGFVVRIQSERHPAYVEKRIETFLESYRSEIAGMNVEEFNKQRKGLVDKQRQRLENLTEESSRFWYHIQSGYHDFTRRERQAQLIEKLTLNDVLEFYDAFLLPSSSTRSKLSIHVHPKVNPTAQFSVAASQVFLEDLKSRDVPVDEAQYTKLSTAEPSVEAVKKFWTPYLSNLPTLPKESATLLLARIDELAQLHPVAKADEDSSLPSDAVVIGDLAKWKTTLGLSPAPIPYSGPDVEQDSEGTVSPKL